MSDKVKKIIAIVIAAVIAIVEIIFGIQINDIQNTNSENKAKIEQIENDTQILKEFEIDEQGMLKKK